MGNSVSFIRRKTAIQTKIDENSKHRKQHSIKHLQHALYNDPLEKRGPLPTRMRNQYTKANPWTMTLPPPQYYCVHHEHVKERDIR